MVVGDVIELDTRLGVVRRTDRQSRMVVVQWGDLTLTEVEDDLDRFEPDRCKVHHNPSRDWPFVKFPESRRFGAITGMTLTGQRPLRLFLDWLPTEFGRGGCVFMSPALGLIHGDILFVQYERGMTRVNVPRTFETVAARAARAEATRQAHAERQAKVDIPTAFRQLRRGPREGT